MTTPGAVCEFSFWLQNSDDENDTDFSTSWDNGAPLVSLVDADQFNSTQYTFTVTGTGWTTSRSGPPEGHQKKSKKIGPDPPSRWIETGH
jgi:hypothetical protein